MNNKVLRRAEQLWRLGFSIVPVKRDGSKRVALSRWEQYQERRCSRRDLQSWFDNDSPFAIGIICGEVSGNLEILDFDDESLIEPFEELLKSESAALLQKLILVETGSGKRHYIYRCVSPPGKRRVLAYNPPTKGRKKGRVAIESRADGCMTIAAGSPADTHPSGSPYRRIGGPRFADIHTLSNAERRQLFRLCRSLTRWVEDDKKRAKDKVFPTDSPIDVTRPGDHFNEVAEWGKDILEPIGFELVREDHDGSQYWLRPGGSHAWSVRTGLKSRNGRDLMRVYSTDTEYFEPDRSYDKFAAYAAVYHRDDLSAAAADLARQDFGQGAEHEDAERADRIHVCSFLQIKSRKVRWVWRRRIPLGKLTVLSGDPSAGKTLTLCDLSARISTGTEFPDGAACRQGDVLILSCEDDAEDTLKPRLEAHGADLTHVHFLTVAMPEGEYEQLDISRHLSPMSRVLTEYPKARVMIFDPLTAYLGSIDSNSNTEVRRVLAPLCDLAREHRVAVIGVSHLTKKETRAVARTLGSMAFVAAARANWIIVRDAKDCDRRLFLQAKNNLADASGLAFRIVDGRVEWEPDPVFDDVDIASQQNRANPREIAEAFLERELQHGPQPAKDLLRKATDRGIRLRTLRRAKKDLGVRSRAFEGQSHWSLEEEEAKPVGQ
jgi:hypothetical protein